MQGRCSQYRWDAHKPATPGRNAKQLMGQTDAAGVKNAATLQGY